MNRLHLKNCHSGLLQTGKGLIHAAALALVLASALPASAGDARAVKSRVTPVYPEIAERMKITGAVKLEAAVDVAGKVTDVKELSGNHMLAVAAEDAVRQWRFAPASGNTSETVSINFAIGQ
jgi:TonB family protein